MSISAGDNLIQTKNIHAITKEMCGHVNRTDQLCGKCVEGTGLPVYSYTVLAAQNPSLFKYIAILNLFK